MHNLKISRFPDEDQYNFHKSRCSAAKIINKKNKGKANRAAHLNRADIVNYILFQYQFMCYELNYKMSNCGIYAIMIVVQVRICF